MELRSKRRIAGWNSNSEEQPDKKKKAQPEENSDEVAKKCVEVTKRRRVRYLPDETWFDVFGRLERIHLSTCNSFVNRQFHRVAHIYLHERSRLFSGSNERRLGRLEIDQNVTGHAVCKQLRPPLYYKNYKVLALPNYPIPQNIVGFEKIDIMFFDPSVLAFLDHIRPLLLRLPPLNISIKHWSEQNTPNAVLLSRLLSNCADDGIKINSLSFSISNNVQLLSDISNKFSALFSQCQLLSLTLDRGIVYHMLKWISEPMLDGRPKMLQLRILSDDHIIFEQFLKILKEKFGSASQPTQFLILAYLNCPSSLEPFVLNNSQTNERLEMRFSRNSKILVTRYAASQSEEEEKRWKEYVNTLDGYPRYCTEAVIELDCPHKTLEVVDPYHVSGDGSDI